MFDYNPVMLMQCPKMPVFRGGQGQRVCIVDDGAQLLQMTEELFQRRQSSFAEENGRVADIPGQTRTTHVAVTRPSALTNGISTAAQASSLPCNQPWIWPESRPLDRDFAAEQCGVKNCTFWATPKCHRLVRNDWLTSFGY